MKTAASVGPLCPPGLDRYGRALIYQVVDIGGSSYRYSTLDIILLSNFIYN